MLSVYQFSELMIVRTNVQKNEKWISASDIVEKRDFVNRPSWFADVIAALTVGGSYVAARRRVPLD